MSQQPVGVVGGVSCFGVGFACPFQLHHMWSSPVSTSPQEHAQSDTDGWPNIDGCLMPFGVFRSGPSTVTALVGALALPRDSASPCRPSMLRTAPTHVFDTGGVLPETQQVITSRHRWGCDSAPEVACPCGVRVPTCVPFFSGQNPPPAFPPFRGISTSL